MLDEWIEAIGKPEMIPRHNHLNALFDKPEV
jgi:hypothetical protein